MPSMKFGHLDEVDVEQSGFEIYDGPMPRPGVYAAKIKVMRVKIGQNSGNAYFSLLVELCDESTSEKKETVGCPIWTNIVPGDSEIQQIRVAQLFRAICGKQGATVVHEEVEDGGAVSKVGGKNPIGTLVRVEVKKGRYNDEARAEVNAVLPAKKEEAAEEIAEVDDDEDFEEEEVPKPAKKAPAKKAAPAKRPAKKAKPEPEEDEDEDDEEEDEVDEVDEAEEAEDEEEESAENDEEAAIPYAEAAGKTLVGLKKLAKEAGYEAADIKDYKSKDKLLALLIEDGVVEEDEADEAPF